MSTRIISTKIADHYKWGGDLDCDGWHLVKTPNLSVIEELMPPGTRESRHYHRRARQFFYVLDGVLTIEIEGQNCVLQIGDGIEVSPGQPHQVFNEGVGSVRMLVTSQPPSHGDRIQA